MADDAASRPPSFVTFAADFLFEPSAIIATMEQAAKKGHREIETVAIDARTAGQRIDNFLRRHVKGVPVTRLYRGLRKGEVRVNGARAKPSYRLSLGDLVRIPPLRRAITRDESPKLPRWLQTRLQKPLYENDELLVLDKPTGVAVHGGSGVGFGLIEALRLTRPDASFLELVHRLDRETSGCLLVAKSRGALLALQEQFHGSKGGVGKAQKQYLALLIGVWEGGSREISAPLQRIRGKEGRRRVVVDAAGQAALSVFRPVARFNGTTLMRIQLFTGRMHQIRAHAAHAGHPVAGDAQYGDWRTNRLLRGLGLKRLFLHAESLRVSQPSSGQPIELSAELPADLQAVLEQLKGDVA